MERVFCRSGKAHSSKRTGERRTFGVRRKEHEKDAKDNPEKSRFHGSYPHKDAAQDTGCARRGYFHNLRFKAALGWKMRLVGNDDAKVLASRSDFR
jgi:hypothetical protein